MAARTGKDDATLMLDGSRLSMMSRSDVKSIALTTAHTTLRQAGGDLWTAKQEFDGRVQITHCVGVCQARRDIGASGYVPLQECRTGCRCLGQTLERSHPRSRGRSGCIARPAGTSELAVPSPCKNVKLAVGALVADQQDLPLCAGNHPSWRISGIELHPGSTMSRLSGTRSSGSGLAGQQG